MSLYQLRGDRRPASHASCTFGALAPAPRTGLRRSTTTKPHF